MQALLRRTAWLLLCLGLSCGSPGEGFATLIAGEDGAAMVPDSPDSPDSPAAGADSGAGASSASAFVPAAVPDAGHSVQRDAGTVDAGSATSRGTTARALVAGGARLIDVRSDGEYQAGHLAGAQNIPVDALAARLDELNPRDAWVVVYCRSGGRSSQAAATLVKGGFLQVFDLGAMANW